MKLSHANIYNLDETWIRILKCLKNIAEGAEKQVRQNVFSKIG